MKSAGLCKGMDSLRSPMPGSGIGGVSRSNVQVFERMSALFPSFPNEALRCLRLFVDQNEDQWFFMRTGKEKGAWTLLEQGMKSVDGRIREAAEAIVHLLGSKGYLEYRELLGKRSPGTN